MRALRQRQERHDERSRRGSEERIAAPSTAKQRWSVMPNQPIPHELFDERDRQERCGERHHPERCNARDETCRNFSRSLPRVHPQERHVRKPVDEDVRHGELKIRVCPNDTDVPRQDGRSDDEVFAVRDGLAFETLADGSSRVGDDEPGPHDLRGHDERFEPWPGDEIAFHEPAKRTRQMRMPVQQRETRGRVDRRIVEPSTGNGTITGVSAVDGDPADLLAYKVKHRDVREHAPERQFRDEVQDKPDGPAGERQRDVERTPAGEFVSVEVRAKERGVDVGDIHGQDKHEPTPRGQSAGVAQARRERGEHQRKRGRTTENGDIRSRTPDEWTAHEMMRRGVMRRRLAMNRGGDDPRKAKDHRADHDRQRRVLIFLDLLTDRERRHLDDDEERDGEHDEADPHENRRGNRILQQSRKIDHRGSPEAPRVWGVAPKCSSWGAHRSLRHDGHRRKEICKREANCRVPVAVSPCRRILSTRA